MKIIHVFYALTFMGLMVIGLGIEADCWRRSYGDGSIATPRLHDMVQSDSTTHEAMEARRKIKFDNYLHKEKRIELEVIAAGEEDESLYHDI